MRPLAMLAALLTMVVSGCGGGEGATLRTAADASHYIEDLFRGASRGVHAAGDATPVARAAVYDSGALGDLHAVVEQAPDVACDVIGLISDIAGALPDSTEPVGLSDAQISKVRVLAFQRDDPQDETDRVMTAVLKMAQSTFVDAADKACDIAESGL